MRVVIADDHDLYRDGLGLLVGSHPEFEVVGEARSTEEAVRVITKHQPDLVLLDVEMDGHPVARTIKIIKRLAPPTRIAILTMHTDRVLREQTIQAGASVFLTKDMPRKELLRALVALTRTFDAPERHAHHPLLSLRELEVLQLLSRAFSNKEIGQWLSIAEGTVKRHTGNIYGKLGARSRMDAVAKAHRLGIM